MEINESSVKAFVEASAREKLWQTQDNVYEHDGMADIRSRSQGEAWAEGTAALPL